MKLLSTISTLLLASLLFASCSDTSGQIAETNNTDDTAAATEAVTEARWIDAIPEGTDLGGKTVVINARGDEGSLLEIDTADEIGEVLNDTIYQRNRGLEERLNFKLELYAGQGWQNYGAELSKIRASIASGDNAWQIISGWGINITPLALEGCFYDLSDMPYLDTSAPWWNRASVNDLTLGGGMFFLTGDVSVLSLLGGAYVMFVNDSLCTAYEIESIPALVRDGTWTMEKMTEISRLVLADLDGSGKYDEHDLYGQVLESNNVTDSFYTSSDIHQITVTNGIPSYTPDPERLVSLMRYLEPMFTDGVSVGCYPAKDAEVQVQMFLNSQAMMIVRELDSARVEFREMKDNYTIVPLPKLDGEQNAYYTAAYNGAALWGIPTDNTDTETTLIVMEAMAAESYHSVTPAYFATCLQEKYARNEETMEMLEIIRDSLYLDSEYMYCDSLGRTSYMVRDMVNGKKYDVASHMAKKEKQILKTIEKTIGKLEEIINE